MTVLAFAARLSYKLPFMLSWLTYRLTISNLRRTDIGINGKLTLQPVDDNF